MFYFIMIDLVYLVRLKSFIIKNGVKYVFGPSVKIVINSSWEP